MFAVVLDFLGWLSQLLKFWDVVLVVLVLLSLGCMHTVRLRARPKWQVFWGVNRRTPDQVCAYVGPREGSWERFVRWLESHGPTRLEVGSCDVNDIEAVAELTIKAEERAAAFNEFRGVNG